MALKYYGLLVVIYLFFFVVTAFPQNSPGHSINVQFGISDFHQRDDHASPIYFSSIGIAPSIKYQLTTASVLHTLEASYFRDNLTGIFEYFNVDNFRGKIKYSYLHKISEFQLFNKNCNLFFGASASSFNNISNFFINGGGMAIKSWYCNHSINFESYFNYNFGNNSFFSLQVSIPLISNISRPNYSPSMDYNYTTNVFKVKLFGKTVYIPDNFFIDINSCYQFPVTDNLNLLFEYEFYYSKYDLPKRTAMYMINLRTGVNICF